MGPGGQRGRRRWTLCCAGAASAPCTGMILKAVLLLGAAAIAGGQTITFSAGSPSLTYTYDWTITKSVGAAAGGTGGATFTANRGQVLNIPYTITVNRQLSGSPVASLSFSANCPLSGGVSAISVSIRDANGNKEVAQSQIAGNTATFTNIPWSRVPSSPTDASQGSIYAVCNYPPPSPGVPSTQTGSPVAIVFTPANTVEIRGTATLADVITWPNWQQYFPTGGWLTTTPTTAVTAGTYPSAGTTVRGPFPAVVQYTWTVSNTLLCFTGAQVTNTATLTAGAADSNQRVYKADASAALTITDCDVKPSMTIDQPVLQTSLTFAWSQALTTLSPASQTVPWGGGGTVSAQATFTRSVTAASFFASFNLAIANPAQAPIAISNLQLACPWGGNILLPCGSFSGAPTSVLNAGFTGGTNQWLVIPASSSITCAVNMLQIPASWGVDFTQPCTLLTSNWLGTQITMQNVVLNFAGPQRWQLINNCASWSVTCSPPTGNPFYVPTIGGLPQAQQVCGSQQSNQPLPPQPFSIAFSGGWIGDGTQPAACASSVTSSCTSQLQLQSTAGTTQNFGGTQTNTLTLQATPIDCPRPPSPVLAPQVAPVLLPSPTPGLNLRSVDPLITAQVTRTVIRGSFTWTVNTQLSPANQLVAQASVGILGRYTVVAAPQTIPGTEAPTYQLEGLISVTNPDLAAAIRVDEVYVVVDNAAVPLGCRPGLPGLLAPSARVDCPFAVNYNQGGAPNTLYGRAVTVSDAGLRKASDGGAVRFSFDAADVSQARGACARVWQSYATNYFDLVQVSGVAPSFNPAEPTTVCSPATWNFDVRFTPREGAPCGVQQVVQTVTTQFSLDATSSPSSSSTANLFVTGTDCPPPPQGFVQGSSTTVPGTAPVAAPAPTAPAPAPAPTTAPAPAPAPALAPAPAPAPAPTPAGGSGPASSTAGGVGRTRVARPRARNATTRSRANSTGSSGARSTMPPVAGPAVNTDALLTQPPAGLSVVVTGVTAQKSTAPAWVVAVEAVDSNVTLSRPAPTVVSFRYSWGRSKAVSDYTGAVVIINNAPEAAELDGVFVNLIDPATGDATDETSATCPGILEQVSSSSTLMIPAGGRINCSFALRSAGSGSIVATVTPVSAASGVSSNAYAAPSLLADSSCSKLVYGMAASELGQQRVLLAGNTTLEDDICAASSKVVSFTIPANATTTRGCSYPVVVMAYVRPDSRSASTGAVASARADVLIPGCTSQLGAAAATAAVAGVSLSKGPSLRWEANITTDPPVTDVWFAGDPLEVTTTWQQRFAPGVRLNASADVALKGATGGAATAKLYAIPMCAPSSNITDCAPVMLQATCKPAVDGSSGASCTANFTGLPFVPGFIQVVSDQAQPSAALPYDSSSARLGPRAAPGCAVLSVNRTLQAYPGAPAARLAVSGATAPAAEPFCGMQQVLNNTLTVDTAQCEGEEYLLVLAAAATPAGAGAPAAKAQLSFNMTC